MVVPFSKADTSPASVQACALLSRRVLLTASLVLLYGDILINLGDSQLSDLKRGTEACGADSGLACPIPNPQPHLPQDLEDRIILRFLHSCYYDIEKTKHTIELFFKIRDNSPELVNHRDPLSPAMQKALKIAKIAQYQIEGDKNIWFWQLNDPGMEQYDYIQDARMFFMTCDAWMLANDYLAAEDIVIMDAKDITLKFITKFNISVARKLSKYQEEAMPIRLKQIHVINAPPFVDKVFALMKPFLRKEVTDMIHFHVPNSEAIYKFISKEDMPEDYGGTKPSMDEMNQKVMEIVMEHRKTYLDENFWKTSKKGKKVKETTFRSLDID